MDDVRKREWEAWCEERLAAVQAVPGNLALVGYQPVGATSEPIEGIDGATVRLAEGRAGVYIEAPGSLGVTVGGEPIDGEVFVARAMPVDPVIIHHDRLRIDAFSLDGSHYELRIYHEDAHTLADFDGIEVYDFDPSVVLDGRFEPHEELEHVAWEFTRVEDTGHKKKVPGTVIVDIGGVERQLSAFLDGDNLVLVFADGTTGAESYAPGRFLALPAPGDDGHMVVDLNRAFIPPCGFSDHYSCPVPPPHNRLDVPVRAGEMRVRWKTPR